MIDREKVKLNLSNFYTEHGYNDINIDFFLDLYMETGKAIEEYLRQVKDNQTIKSMEVFRKYNFAAFPAHDACYDIAELLSNPKNSELLGVSGSLSEKIEQWTSLDNDVKVDFLNSQEKYIKLSAKRSFDDIEPEILSLRIKDLNKKEYREGMDFALSNNKLYLLGSGAEATVKNSDLIAFDIFVDYDTPNRLVGSRIGVGYNKNITKSEYRDFVAMVSYALIKGPTIKNLKDAFNVLIGWDGSEITDKYKATGVRKEMWENPSTAILTPFDFLVTIPASLISTVGISETDGGLIPVADRLDIFRSFLDVVKPIDTNYILALSEVIEEAIDSSDVFSQQISFETEDESYVEDEGSNDISIDIEDDMIHSDLLYNINYDSGDMYDSGFSYDEDTLSQGPTSYGDIMSLKLIEYPEFPVDFSASLSVMTGYVNISFKDNAVDVEGYEVKRNGQIIFDVPASGDGSLISLTDNEAADLPSGNYDYFARSYYLLDSERKYSRPSKKITINK